MDPELSDKDEICGKLQPSCQQFTECFHLPNIKQETPGDCHSRYPDSETGQVFSTSVQIKQENTASQSSASDSNHCLKRRLVENYTQQETLSFKQSYAPSIGYVMLESVQHESEVANPPMQFAVLRNLGWSSEIKQELNLVDLTTTGRETWLKQEAEDEEHDEGTVAENECKIDIVNHLLPETGNMMTMQSYTHSGDTCTELARLNCSHESAESKIMMNQKEQMDREDIEYSKVENNASAVTNTCKACFFTTRVKQTLRDHLKMKHDPKDKPYQCAECDYTTKYMRCLKSHALVTHNAGPDVYHCRKCDFATKQKDKLQQHVRVRHEVDKKVHLCAHCNYGSKSRKSLVQHTRVKHDPNTKTFKCKHCYYTTNGKDYLRQHVRYWHDAVAHELPDCSFSGFANHQLTTPQACKHSEYDFQTEFKKYRKKHVRLEHNPNVPVYKCLECDFETVTSARLTEHVRLKHDPRAEVYKCTECDFRTKQKNKLGQHMRVRHEVDAEVHLCAQCNYGNKSENSLVQHKALKHNPSVEAYKCADCYYVTNDKDFLMQHVAYWHDAVVHECPDCSYTTDSSYRFASHKLKHNPNAQAYKCPVCDFTSKFKMCITRHVRVEHNHNV